MPLVPHWIQQVHSRRSWWAPHPSHAYLLEPALSFARSGPGQVYGIVGNPVGHSRSPLLHNAGFGSIGYDAVYVPLLVDDLARLLASPRAPMFAGLSVTIPHKVGRL